MSFSCYCFPAFSWSWLLFRLRFPLLGIRNGSYAHTKIQYVVTANFFACFEFPLESLWFKQENIWNIIWQTARERYIAWKIIPVGLTTVLRLSRKNRESKIYLNRSWSHYLCDIVAARYFCNAYHEMSFKTAAIFSISMKLYLLEKTHNEKNWACLITLNNLLSFPYSALIKSILCFGNSRGQH